MKKKNLMKSLTALALSVLMVLSLAACGAKPSDGGKDEDKDGYTVAIIKQMDHASLDDACRCAGMGWLPGGAGGCP